MKAITIHQPWATLIALGEKKFETRGWATKYRGPIAIHAGKQIDMTAMVEPEIRAALLLNDITDWTQLPFGAVIATATLAECWAVSTYDQDGSMYLFEGVGGGTRSISFKEEKFGWYEPGRYAWELANVRRIEPLPAKGQQGLWNWDNPAGE